MVDDTTKTKRTPKPKNVIRGGGVKRKTTKGGAARIGKRKGARK